MKRAIQSSVKFLRYLRVGKFAEFGPVLHGVKFIVTKSLEIRYAPLGNYLAFRVAPALLEPLPVVLEKCAGHSGCLSPAILLVLISPRTTILLPFLMYSLRNNAVLSHATIVGKSAVSSLLALSTARLKLVQGVPCCVYLSSTSAVSLPVKITTFMLSSCEIFLLSPRRIFYTFSQLLFRGVFFLSLANYQKSVCRRFSLRQTRRNKACRLQYSSSIAPSPFSCCRAEHHQKHF
ncbi:hypothetical protein 2016_scaffold57_00128 [Bacteriophage sp.]|nr:hypothetical protein 2016_scaffold57_00128 [Bacteriophage sp.]